MTCDLSWLALPTFIFAMLAGFGILGWGVGQIVKWENAGTKPGPDTTVQPPAETTK
jgi:hypothetical protein